MKTVKRSSPECIEYGYVFDIIEPHGDLFVVLFEERAFGAFRTRKTLQLYRDYLDNFRINRGER